MPDAFDCDDEVHGIDRRIASAWAALAGARAAATHSPNGETVALENMCERTVNELLERRYELVEAERIVRA
jgi:hypothetical protein